MVLQLHTVERVQLSGDGFCALASICQCVDHLQNLLPLFNRHELLARFVPMLLLFHFVAIGRSAADKVPAASPVDLALCKTVLDCRVLNLCNRGQNH